MNPPSGSIYDLSDVSISNEILCFKDRQTFKRVLNELGEKYDEDSLYFNFNDTTISEDSVPFYPSLDIFENDMSHLSLRSKIESEIWNVIVDPYRSVLNDFPDTGHIADPFMQTIFNEYHEIKISDTIFKSINSCTTIEIIDNDGLAVNLRNNGLQPTTADLNFPDMRVENVAWDCGDCRVSFKRNTISKTAEGINVQFIPYKIDSIGDTILTGFEFSWRFNDTLKSNDQSPTFFLPDDVDLDVNLITRNGDCYYETGGAYKRGDCLAKFKIKSGQHNAGDYNIYVEDYGSECSFAACPIVDWTYDYGDGTMASSQDPLHRLSKNYSEAGEYVVKLKITDSDLCTNETEHEVEFGKIKDCCKTFGNGYDHEFYDDATSGFDEKLFLGDGWVSNYAAIQVIGSRVTYYEWSTFYNDYTPKRAIGLETGLSGKYYNKNCVEEQQLVAQYNHDYKQNRKSVYYRLSFGASDFRRIQKDKLAGDWAGEDSDNTVKGGSYFINPQCR